MESPATFTYNDVMYHEDPHDQAAAFLLWRQRTVHPCCNSRTINLLDLYALDARVLMRPKQAETNQKTCLRSGITLGSLCLEGPKRVVHRTYSSIEYATSQLIFYLAKACFPGVLPNRCYLYGPHIIAHNTIGMICAGEDRRLVPIPL